MKVKTHGRTGLRQFGGNIYEEFVSDLRGANGIEVFKEMEMDDTCGAILYAIDILCRQVDWIVNPAGDTEEDKKAAQFINECLYDMSDTWTNNISEILTFLIYGWSWLEILYKRRNGNKGDFKSNYDDGLIGWASWDIRSQETLQNWEFDEYDRVIGMTQNVDGVSYTIPRDKSLHFMTKSRKGNPEGVSIFRNAYKCFDEETEILTKDGWKKGIEISTNDLLATLNPQTKTIEYEKPTEINKYHHNGEMINFKSRFVDIKVTPDHRMWTRKDKQKEYKIVEARKMNARDKIMCHGSWTGEERKTYTIPEYEVYQTFRNGERKLKEVQEAMEVNMDDWVSFLGLYLAEGCTHETKNGQCIVNICQKEGKDADEIRELLKRLPFNICESKKQEEDKVNFNIYDKRLYTELKKYGKSWEKYAPEYLKELRPEQINKFINWYAFGDGTKVGGSTYKNREYKGTTQIFTTSKRMANDLQELALLGGKIGRLRTAKKQESHWGNRPLYIVSICKPMEFSVRNINKEEYDGVVWCPTTKNGIVYVRRNGKPAWVGNCWYFKKRIQELEGIGVERDLAGLPMITAPEGVDIWNAEDETITAYRIYAETLVRNVRRDATEGVVMPNGWEFKLLSSGGSRNFDTGAVIERYDKRIAMTVLADFMLLGQDGSGSYAMATNKSEIFMKSLKTYLDGIEDEINKQAIPKLIDLNKDHFTGITDYPTIDHGDLTTQSMQEVGTFLKDMVSSGVLTPDEGIEDFVRSIGKLPERPDAAFNETLVTVDGEDQTEVEVYKQIEKMFAEEGEADE